MHIILYSQMQSKKHCSYYNLQNSGIRENFRGNPLNWNQTHFHSLLHAHACTFSYTYTHTLTHSRGAATRLHDLIGCSWEAKPCQLVLLANRLPAYEHVCTRVYIPIDPAATGCLASAAHLWPELYSEF